MPFDTKSRLSDVLARLNKATSNLNQRKTTAPQRPPARISAPTPSPNPADLTNPVPPTPAPPTPLAPQTVEPTARKRIIPPRFMRLEPLRPISAINDDPLFDTHDAAKILGVSDDLLKKWRQRNRGPHYVQYGQSGPVRYLLSDLKAYIAAHEVRPGNEQQ